jgi:Uncharacterized protein conserved in bacteria (DUF2237)
MARNVLGTELESCSVDPLTGFHRSGCCETGVDDLGVNVVGAEVTDEFLAFSRSQGNDLSTPQPGFPGLRPATDGACVRHGGRKHSMPVRRRRSSSKRRTCRRWSGCRSAICAGTPSGAEGPPEPV